MIVMLYLLAACGFVYFILSCILAVHQITILKQYIDQNKEEKPIVISRSWHCQADRSTHDPDPWTDRQSLYDGRTLLEQFEGRSNTQDN